MDSTIQWLSNMWIWKTSGPVKLFQDKVAQFYTGRFADLLWVATKWSKTRTVDHSLGPLEQIH